MYFKDINKTWKKSRYPDKFHRFLRKFIFQFKLISSNVKLMNFTFYLFKTTFSFSLKLFRINKVRNELPIVLFVTLILICNKAILSLLYIYESPHFVHQMKSPILNTFRLIENFLHPGKGSRIWRNCEIAKMEGKTYKYHMFW